MRDHSHNLPVLAEDASSSSGTEVSGFENSGDTRYLASVSAFGSNFSVILDTGSSDLWYVTTGMKFVNEGISYINTSVYIELDYGFGSEVSIASGDILATNMEFAGFDLSNVTVVGVTNVTQVAGLLGNYINGLMGLSPPTMPPAVQGALRDANSSLSGDSILQQIFAENPDVPPYFTFLLSRTEEDSLVAGGNFTIGEVVPGYEGVLEAPQLPVTDSPWGPRWAFNLDGIIIEGQEYVSSGSNLTAMLDSGTVTGFIDSQAYELIYGDYSDGIPCDTMLNVSLIISDQEYPFHPIDLTKVTSGTNGTLTCGPALEPLSGYPAGTFLLGDAFLRNVYALYNSNGYTQPGDALPYTQLLSVTELAAAYAEFPKLNAQRQQTYCSFYGCGDSE